MTYYISRVLPVPFDEVVREPERPSNLKVSAS